MRYATLSADIVRSTSLSTDDTIRLKNFLQQFLNHISSSYKGTWGRIIKGDGLELVTEMPNDILRIALLLKCYIRMFKPQDESDKYFKKYGIRIAVSVGGLRINDETKGIIDGEAIYMSGRGLDMMSDKTENLRFFSNDESLSGMDVIYSLLDVLLSKATSRQCETIYYRLQGYNETKTAEILGINQSAVNQHCASANWSTIAMALQYFDNCKEIN